MPHKELVSLSKRHHDNQDYSVAEFGHTDAQFHLGYCYKNGWAVEQYHQQAVYSFPKAVVPGLKVAIKAMKRLNAW